MCDKYFGDSVKATLSVCQGEIVKTLEDSGLGSNGSCSGAVENYFIHIQYNVNDLQFPLCLLTLLAGQDGEAVILRWSLDWGVFVLFTYLFFNSTLSPLYLCRRESTRPPAVEV